MLYHFGVTRRVRDVIGDILGWAPVLLPFLVLATTDYSAEAALPLAILITTGIFLSATLTALVAPKRTEPKHPEAG